MYIPLPHQTPAEMALKHDMGTIPDPSRDGTKTWQRPQAENMTVQTLICWRWKVLLSLINFILKFLSSLKPNYTIETQYNNHSSEEKIFTTSYPNKFFYFSGVLTHGPQVVEYANGRGFLQDFVLIVFENGQSEPEQDLAPLVEKYVPDTQHGLIYQPWSPST